MIQSDLLLQQIIDQGKTQNDNLTEIKKAILERNGGGNGGGPGNGGGGGPGGGGNGGGGPGNARTIFQRLQDAVGVAYKGITDQVSILSSNTMNGSDQAVKTFSSTIGTVGNVLGMLPGPAGAAGQALTQVAAAGEKVYEWLNAQHKQYQTINESGVALAEGFMSLRKGSVSSMMSVDQLSTVIKNNSLAFSSMNDSYGDGIARFSSFIGSLQQAQVEAGLYGISQDRLADLTAKNFKMQKLYGINQQMNDIESTRSTIAYVGQVDQLSKVMGQSIDALMKKTESLMDSSDVMALQVALETMQGFTPELAGKVNKGLSTAFASMGEAGEDMMHDYADFISSGGRIDQEKYGAASAVMANLFNSLRAMGASAQDPAKVKSIADKVLKSESVQYQLKQQLLSAQNMQNKQMANTIAGIQKYAKLSVDPSKTENPLKGWDGLMERFNKWSAASIQPMQKFFNDSLDGIADWLGNIADITKSPGEFLSQLIIKGTDKLFDGLQFMVDKLNIIPEKIIGFIAGEDVGKAVSQMLSKAFSMVMAIPRNIINFVQKMIFGTDEQQKEALGSIPKLISDFWNTITGGIKSLFNLDWNIDGIKQALSSSWESIKSTVSGVWSSISDAVKGLFTFDWGIDGVKEVIGSSWESVKSSVSGFWNSISDSVSSLTTMDWSMDSVYDKINESWDSMKSSVAGWWDKLTSWFKNKPEEQKNSPLPVASKTPTPTSSPVTKTTAGVNKQPIMPNPTQTPPVQINVPPSPQNTASNSSNQGPQQATPDDILRTLNKIMQSNGHTNDALQNLASYLRTIASNTTPERNV